MAVMLTSTTIQVEYVSEPLRITSMVIMFEHDASGPIIYPDPEDPPEPPEPPLPPPVDPELPLVPVVQQLGGFKFKGIHSSVFGVRQTARSKVLFPLKRRELVKIPGRSRAAVQQDGGYDPRVESILCSYATQRGINLHNQVRKIAEWLDGIGELTFDFEPNRHYNAYVSSPPSLAKLLDGAIFEVEFTMNHPFAYETTSEESELLSSEALNNLLEVFVEGTVETPTRIIIKNNTNRTMTGLKINHRNL